MAIFALLTGISFSGKAKGVPEGFGWLGEDHLIFNNYIAGVRTGFFGQLRRRGFAAGGIFPGETVAPSPLTQL